MGNRKAGTEEAVDPGLDAAGAAAGGAPALEQGPTDQEGGEPSAKDAAEASSDKCHAGAEAAEESSTDPCTEPQALEGAEEPASKKASELRVLHGTEASRSLQAAEQAEPAEDDARQAADEAGEAQALESAAKAGAKADAQAAEASSRESAAEEAGGSQAHEGAEEPAAGEPEPQAQVGVEEPAAVESEPQAPMGLKEPAAVEAAEARKPGARHRKRGRTTAGRLLRRVTITMGAAVLVTFIWYLASSAVVFSRPSPVDGQQPTGAEQLDDRVIVRKTHVPAATPRMGGANAPINQAVGGIQPASAGHAPEWRSERSFRQPEVVPNPHADAHTARRLEVAILWKSEGTLPSGSRRRPNR